MLGILLGSVALTLAGVGLYKKLPWRPGSKRKRDDDGNECTDEPQTPDNNCKRRRQEIEEEAAHSPYFMNGYSPLNPLAHMTPGTTSAPHQMHQMPLQYSPVMMAPMQPYGHIDPFYGHNYGQMSPNSQHYGPQPYFGPQYGSYAMSPSNYKPHADGRATPSSASRDIAHMVTGSNSIASSLSSSQRAKDDAIGSGDAGTAKPTEKPVLEEPKSDTLNIDKSTYNLVYFDLETTGLLKSCDILQVAAVTEEKVYDQYSIPHQAITSGASAVNHLTMDKNKGQLLYKGAVLEATSIKENLQSFFEFLKEIKNPVLVAHNCKNFDAQILINNIERENLLVECSDVISGFIDTLPLLREMYPDMESHALGAVYLKLFKSLNFDAHNAIDDVKALKRIIDFSKPSDSQFGVHSFSFDYAVKFSKYKQKYAFSLSSYDNLKKDGVLSGYTTRALAGQGIGLKDLKSAYFNSKIEGLNTILSRTNLKVKNKEELIKKLDAYFRRIVISMKRLK